MFTPGPGFLGLSGQNSSPVFKLDSSLLSLQIDPIKAVLVHGTQVYILRLSGFKYLLGWS